MQDGQRQFVQDALEQKAQLSAVIPVASATGVALLEAATDPIGPLKAQISGWQALVSRASASLVKQAAAGPYLTSYFSVKTLMATEAAALVSA